MVKCFFTILVKLLFIWGNNLLLTRTDILYGLHTTFLVWIENLDAETILQRVKVCFPFNQALVVVIKGSHTMANLVLVLILTALSKVIVSQSCAVASVYFTILYKRLTTQLKLPKVLKPTLLPSLNVQWKATIFHF